MAQEVIKTTEEIWGKPKPPLLPTQATPTIKTTEEIWGEPLKIEKPPSPLKPTTAGQLSPMEKFIQQEGLGKGELPWDKYAIKIKGKTIDEHLRDWFGVDIPKAIGEARELEHPPIISKEFLKGAGESIYKGAQDFIAMGFPEGMKPGQGLTIEQMRQRMAEGKLPYSKPYKSVMEPPVPLGEKIKGITRLPVEFATFIPKILAQTVANPAGMIYNRGFEVVIAVGATAGRGAYKKIETKIKSGEKFQGKELHRIVRRVPDDVLTPEMKQKIIDGVPPDYNIDLTGGMARMPRIGDEIPGIEAPKPIVPEIKMPPKIPKEKIEAFKPRVIEEQFGVQPTEVKPLQPPQTLEGKVRGYTEGKPIQELRALREGKSLEEVRIVNKIIREQMQARIKEIGKEKRRTPYEKAQELRALREAEQLEITEFEKAGKVEKLKPKEEPAEVSDIKRATEELDQMYSGIDFKKEFKESWRRFRKGEIGPEIYTTANLNRERVRASFPDIAKEAKEPKVKEYAPKPEVGKPPERRGVAWGMPLGGTPKPTKLSTIKKLGKLNAKSPEIEHHLDYMNQVLKDGKVEIPKDFSNYKNFKDVKRGWIGGSKQPHYWMPEVDGSPKGSFMAKQPEGGTPMYKHVYIRNHDMILQGEKFANRQSNRMADIFEGISKKQDMSITLVLKELSQADIKLSPEILAKRPTIKAVTTDVNLIKRAIEARKIYDDWHLSQNIARELRGQRQIPFREKYSPDIIKEMSLWEKTKGLRDKAEIEFEAGPEIPDYIFPDKPFNPHELAKEYKLKDQLKENRASKIMEEYLGTVTKDIYHTNIIVNNKAFARELERLGKNKAAQTLNDYTAETFAGVKSIIDRGASLGITFNKILAGYRKGLHRVVFPFHVAWTVGVQTSSSVLTFMRYGPKHSAKGLRWFTDKKLRSDIAENSYSYIVKTLRGGRVETQGINEGIMRVRRLEKKPLTKIEDWGNYFLGWVEKHLTGWSSATAKSYLDELGIPKGRVYWERVSEGGAKTQSLYNKEDMPGALRSNLVRSAGPFQTFSFEVFNSIREILGQTGIAPETAMQRAKMVLRFAAGTQAMNIISKTTIGRKPWQIESLIPWSNFWLSPIVSKVTGKKHEWTSRWLPSPVAVLRDFATASQAVIEKNDWGKMRRWMTKYGTGFTGIPGGTQLSNITEGLIAISKGGVYEPSGRMMFPVSDTLEQIRAVMTGPYRTKAAQEYFEKREGNGKKKKRRYAIQ